MIGTKKCHRCGISKPLTNFYKCTRAKDGRQSICKECSSKKGKEWYLKNKAHHAEVSRQWREKNYTKVIAKQREYYKENRETILRKEKEHRDRNPEKTKEIYRRYYLHHKEVRAQYRREHKDKVYAAHKKYREAHRELIKQQSKKYREKNKDKINQRRLERLHSDPVFARRQRLQLAVKMAIKTAMKNGVPRKTSLAKTVTGLAPTELWQYLLKTWEQEYGAPWNGEKYNIDHIIPCCSASTVEGIDKLFHYTNLRLLTPEDNTKKKAEDLKYCKSLSVFAR